MDDKELKAKIEEGNKYYQDFIEGTKYMVPQKHKDWLKFVSKCYERFGAESVKPLIDVLKDFYRKIDFNVIKEKVDKVFDDGAGYSLAVNTIVRFAKNGPEFYEYVHPNMDSESKKFVNQQKEKNRQYDYELKYGEPEEHSLCKDC